MQLLRSDGTHQGAPGWGELEAHEHRPGPSRGLIRRGWPGRECTWAVSLLHELSLLCFSPTCRGCDASLRARVGRGMWRPCQLLWLMMGQGGPWTHPKCSLDATRCPQSCPWLPAPHPQLSNPPSPASWRPTEPTPGASVKLLRLCPGGGPHLCISLLHIEVHTVQCLMQRLPAPGTTHPPWCLPCSDWDVRHSQHPTGCPSTKREHGSNF